MDNTHSYESHNNNNTFSELSSFVGPSYTDILTRCYKKVKSDATESPIEKLCLSSVNNEIWCVTDAGNIQVRSSVDCKIMTKRLNNKTLNSYKGVKSIVQTDSGNFIVAAKFGIYLLADYISNSLKAISQECDFVDVCIYSDCLYALQETTIEHFTHTNLVVKCFKRTVSSENQSEWYTIYKNIELETTGNFGRHNWDKICVQNNLIHVSSIWNNCFYVYNMEGEILYSRGEFGYQAEYPGLLYGPHLCGVDCLGNLLLADWNNNRLQVWKKAEDTWCNVETLQPLGIVNRPTHVVMDQSFNHLWVATNKEIIKFSRKDISQTSNTLKNSSNNGVSSSCIIL